MINRCLTCKHHKTSSRKIGIMGKDIIGDYCNKHKWNLNKVKTWKQKLQSVRTVIKYPPMTKISGDCYESH